MRADSSWQLATAPASLAEGEVHVWKARLETPPADLERALAGLDDGERTRAARIRVESGRSRYIARQAFVRAVLAGYAGVPREALGFRRDPGGKPRLEGGGRRPEVEFNVADSGDLALVAVSHRGAVGVDVERERELRNLDGLLERFFSEGQRGALLALPPRARPRAFFQLWALTEAFVKATGQGLRGLSKAEVSVDPTAEPWVAERGCCPDGRWWAARLDAGPGYAAALVVAGGKPVLRLFERPAAAGEP